jgi:hypothetical protein
MKLRVIIWKVPTSSSPSGKQGAMNKNKQYRSLQNPLNDSPEMERSRPQFSSVATQPPAKQ